MAIKINPDARKKAVSFIRRQPVGVLATASLVGYPHAATVYVVVDDQANLYFVTKENTMKYQNISENPNVSIAIFDSENQQTLQASGHVEQVRNMADFMHLFAEVLEISHDTSESERPPVSKLFAGDYFMYQLTPTNMRMAEYKKPDRGDMSDIFQVVIKDD